MAKDHIEGAARIAKGSIKEAIGKIAGNPTTEAQGAAEQASGRAQEAADKGKDARRHPGKV